MQKNQKYIAEKRDTELLLDMDKPLDRVMSGLDATASVR
jgi:hypothetical protein